jgi:hypothetical protein
MAAAPPPLSSQYQGIVGNGTSQDPSTVAEPEQTPSGMTFASQASVRPTLQAEPSDATLPGPDGRDNASRSLPNGAEPPRPQGLQEELSCRMG